MREIAVSSAVFASDIHACAALPKTCAAFCAWLLSLSSLAPKPEALFLLGDVFEAYCGDDDTDPAIAQVSLALQTVSRAGIRIALLHGNRDFLVGANFCQRIGANVSLLPEQCVISCGEQRVLIAHGDEWCTLDTAYQTARLKLRSAAFQTDFLSQPLSVRHAIAAQLRGESGSAKAALSMTAMNVTTAAVLASARAAQATAVLHGHTHTPGVFPLEGEMKRYVLSDWEFDAPQNRANFARLNAQGLTLSAYPSAGLQ